MADRLHYEELMHLHENPIAASQKTLQCSDANQGGQP
jgi:hypothetical protein